MDYIDIMIMIYHITFSKIGTLIEVMLGFRVMNTFQFGYFSLKRQFLSVQISGCFLYLGQKVYDK
jgi:hypothetical protein